MRSTFAASCLAFLLVGCSSKSPSSSSSSDDGLELAKDLAITNVDLYQTLKVPLAKDGEIIIEPRAVPIVAGKAALVRVYVAPGSAWTPREVTGELKLSSPSGDKKLTLTGTPSAASTEAKLDSTFNFEVPDGVLAPDTTYSVRLRVRAGSAGGGSNDAAAFPRGGAPPVALGAKATGESLKITIIPVRYDGDSSGRLPDLGDAALESYRAAMYAMYPTKKVEITVHDGALRFAGTIDRTGAGFTELLQQVIRLRQKEAAPKDVYYYGLFLPSKTFEAYCRGACVSGLSSLSSSAGDTWMRASVGVAFLNGGATETMQHELGHAHGRSHAPCGDARDIDPKFPYKDGETKIPGYDLTTREIVPLLGDVMGYCHPTWVSDYTYGALFERMRQINDVPAASVVGRLPTAARYRMVSIAGDGTPTWGPTVDSLDAPIGEPRTVRWLRADGTLGEAIGAFYRYGDLPGGYWVVEEPSVDATALYLPDVTRDGAEQRLPVH